MKEAKKKRYGTGGGEGKMGYLPEKIASKENGASKDQVEKRKIDGRNMEEGHKGIKELLKPCKITKLKNRYPSNIFD